MMNAGLPLKKREEREREHVRATQIPDRVQPLPTFPTDEHTLIELPQCTVVEPLFTIQSSTASSQLSCIDVVEFASDFPPVDERPTKSPPHYS